MPHAGTLGRSHPVGHYYHCLVLGHRRQVVHFSFILPFILRYDRAFRRHLPANTNKRPMHYFTTSSLSFLGEMSLPHKSRCQPTTIHMGNKCYSHCATAPVLTSSHNTLYFFLTYESWQSLRKRLMVKVPFIYGSHIATTRRESQSGLLTGFVSPILLPLLLPPCGQGTLGDSRSSRESLSY